VYKDRVVRFVRFANNDSIYSREILLGIGFYNGVVKVTSTEDVIIYRVPTWDSPGCFDTA
jgi:hypothetical protein